MTCIYAHKVHISTQNSVIIERMSPGGFIIQKWQYFEVIKTNGVTKSVSALS